MDLNALANFTNRYPYVGAAVVFLMLNQVVGIGWTWTLLIMAAGLVHEGGHAIAARLCGLPILAYRFSPIGAMMIPGAPITPRLAPPIMLAGPVFGLLAAALSAATYLVTDDARFAGFAGFIVAFNLISLLPIGLQDGGHIVRLAFDAVSPVLSFALICVTYGALLATGLLDWRFFALVGVYMYVSMPLLRHSFEAVNFHVGIVLPLARAYGVRRDVAAVLAARQNSKQQIVLADARRQPIETSEADGVWEDLDERLRSRGHDDGLRPLLEERAARPPQLTVRQALGWLAAYAICVVGMVWCLQLADQVMSLREFIGVLLHSRTALGL